MVDLSKFNFPRSVEDKIRFWLGDEFDKTMRNEIHELIEKGDREELYDRFYTELDFGTGGLRGIIGAGTNRMNTVIVGMATQGLANYILEATSLEDTKAVIAHDCRNFSREFAIETASVLAANGITTYLFKDLRPTPELSFAVRRLDATSGVVITASHNPKEYNGYKVYWSDGAQVVPPHDDRIIEEVRKIKSISEVKRIDFEQAVAEGSIKILGDEIDRAYLDAIAEESLTPELNKERGDELKIVFTPLHGAAITLVPKALKEWGFSNVAICEEQATPDGNFPSVRSPNPEDREALEPAISFATKEQADIILANDPDCDRLGVVCRQPDGSYKHLTGNQMCALMTHFILSRLKEQEGLPERPAVVTTIVTTPMMETIARSFDVHTEYTLTGFKWICEKVRIWESLPDGSEDKYRFIYGCEESLGHVVGTSVRDKDGVIAACITAEIALHAKIRENKTLLELMDSLYRRYGVFIEQTKSIYLTGAEGGKTMDYIMKQLREESPREIGGLEVLYIDDVKLQKRINARTGETVATLNLPVSNVLVFELSGGNKVIARPSGTEPKIKFYFLFRDTRDLPIPDEEELKNRKEKLRKIFDTAHQDFLNIINRLIETFEKA